MQQLLDELLPPDRQAVVRGHLEACPACRQLLETLAAGGELAPAAVRRLACPGPEPGAALCRVMNELCSLPRMAVTGGSPDAALEFLDPPADPRHLGRLGRYEVTRVIGWGGMGVVLEAQDPSLHRTVAVKVIAPALAANGTARKRFLREAQAAARVRHENVIAIYAVEEVRGQTCLLMEYVPGVSLQERLKRTGPPGVPEIVRIGAQVASGLAAAHALGVIHRDIKPANILLEEGSGRVKITDFGLARATDHPRLTQSGVLVGTPEYMAPEQARGEAVDHRADLFSLGSVLYAVCTGRSPFRAGSTLAVLRRLCEDEPADIRELNPKIPSWLVRVIEQLQGKDPAERFQSAAEVAGILGRHLPGPVRGASPAPEPSGDTTRLAVSRSIPWGWIGLGAGVLLAALVLGTAAVLYFPQGSGEGADLPGQERDKQMPGFAHWPRGDMPRPPARAVPDPRNEDLRAILLNLRAGDPRTRQKAAEQLEAMQPVDADRDAVAAALEQHLDEPAHFPRLAIIRALGVWGTADSVPALIWLLQHEDVFTRRAALLALGKFRDTRAAEAVAGGLDEALNRYTASQALQMMGPVAEAAVARRLGHNDWSIRREACAILQAIGTKQSVPALEAAARDGNGIVAQAATAALAAIKARR